MKESWVPPNAWLAPGYAEWQPPAALRGPVSCQWARIAPETTGNDIVLPDACSDLIWEQGVGAYVAGPDTGPVPVATKPGLVLAGVRFRPAAGGQLLGLPLSELKDQRVPLADLLPKAARDLSPDLDPAEAAARLRDLAKMLAADADEDLAVTRAANLLRDPTARAEDIAGQTGLSERQLRRRCHAAAGYGPKTLQRILRFQRFVRELDAGPELPDLAATALAAGYADQPHLTRECRALSGHPPAALHRLRKG